jgi:hypothetical protein
VEVLAIDEVEGTVKIKNHGQLQTLSFATDGATPTTMPSPFLITTIFSDKRAGLKWPVAPTRPGEQP